MMKMRTGKVRACGQVTIPARVRREVGIHPGDIILFRATDQGRGEFIVIPAHIPLDELWARYRGSGRFDAELVWAQVAEDMTQRVLPKIQGAESRSKR
jgi:AbrB family looped-hinge helix DNA binding protein